MTGVRFSPDGQIVVLHREQRDGRDLPGRHDAEVHDRARGGGGRGGDARAGAARRPAAPAAAAAAAARRGGDGPGTLVGVGGGGGGGGGRGGGGGGRGGGGGGGGGPVLLSADGTSVFLQGSSGGGRGANAAAGARRSSTRSTSRPARRRGSSRARTPNITETISAILDPTTKRLVLTRQNATTPPQQFLFDNGNAQAAHEQRGSVPGSHADDRAALHGDARGRLHVPHDRLPAVELPGRHADARLLLVLPARVHVAGAVRRRPRRRRRRRRRTTFPNFGTLSKQFLVRLGYAVIENDAPIVGADGADEQQLRQRPAQQPVGDDRRARSSGS